MYWLYGIGAIVALVVGVAVYLRARFVRQHRVRDEALWQMLQPIGARLLDGDAVDAVEVRELARRPAPRIVLLGLLKHAGKTALFPSELLTRRAEAESKLASWLMLPNELQNEPSELDLMEIASRSFRGTQVEIYVFKYKMPAGHWSGDDWQLAVVGPFFEEDKPYEGKFGAFARAGDRVGTLEPTDLVDWYMKLVDTKFPADA
jgi:hypothetical protein